MTAHARSEAKANPLERVVVVGTSSSGKTTLARTLATRLDLPHVELDALHWEPGWREAETPVFRGRVDEALRGSRWVADGNYGTVRDLVWGRAASVIWLDYSFWCVYGRALRRTLRRLRTQEELWAGNREEWRNLIDPEGIPIWVLRTYHRNRRKFPHLFAQPEYGHLDVRVFRTPAETEAFVRALPGADA